MRAIVILSDTLNRRYLSEYGNRWVNDPNICRLAERSTVFTNHWCGSAPCMPARRDIFTGRLNFLERSWGGIEPQDQTFVELLRKYGVHTCMETDHYHYMELGGEGYMQLFDTYECIRGQETDQLPCALEKRVVPDHYGNVIDQYQKNRAKFRCDDQYPTAVTLNNAADWLRVNQKEDNFLLFVEAFDPHEPFDTPDEYLEAYEKDYQDKFFNWPFYDVRTNESSAAVEHIKRRYAATLSMLDKHIGKLLDVVDEGDMWKDTMIILTTDHGYMLGEHGYFAKNYMPAYNEIMHLPLMIHQPGQTEKRYCGALTQNIDLFPTILEQFKIPLSECRNRIHGKSLLPVLYGEASSVRDYALYGYFGKSVNFTNGKFTYFKAAVREDNSPLYLYMSMPTTIRQFLGGDAITDVMRIEMGRSCGGQTFPFIKYQPTLSGLKTSRRHSTSEARATASRALRHRERL